MIRLRPVALALVLIGAVAASPSVASAHPPPFFWMPDLANDGRVGVEVMAGNIELLSDGEVVSAHIYGTVPVTDQLSVVLGLPIAYANFALLPQLPGDQDESAVVLGNLSAGLNLATSGGRRSGPRFGGGLRVSLPTAPDEGDGLLAAQLNTLFHFPDLGRYAPNTTTLRIHGEARTEAGQLFFQGHLAVDLHLVDGADDLTSVVIGTGAGVSVTPYVALLAELTTVSDILEDSENENFIHSLDLGMRYHNPAVMFGARLYVPLDDRLREADMLGIGFDVGARF